MIRVESLYIYPVKSCRGIAVSRVAVERRGFRGDRRWMIVRDDGTFITQRDQARLCMVGTELSERGIVLTYQNDQIEVPGALQTGPRLAVTVWRSTVEAIEFTPARSMISEAAGESARLVYMPDDVERAVSETYARPGDIVSFADGFPVLLASTASLHDLEHRAGLSLAMARFRPNIVVSGAEPFEEDTWSRLSVGGNFLRAAKPCERCVVTTIDPETAAAGKEPLRTLATYRKRDNAVHFAINLIPESHGELGVGDPVSVVA
jgi:uncharacterized protein YcbX